MIYIVAGNLPDQINQKVEELLDEAGLRSLTKITFPDQFMNDGPISSSYAKDSILLILGAEDFLDSQKTMSRLNRLVTFKLTELHQSGALIVLTTSSSSRIDKRIRNQAIGFLYLRQDFPSADYINSF